MPRKLAPPPTIYQLKLTLIGSSPAIFRRLLVPADEILEYLHHVIQLAMPWNNSHLHQFRDVQRKRYWADPDFELEYVNGDETTTCIADLLKKPKDRLIYDYDFGDSWEHEIKLEKILPPDPTLKLPACTAGKLAAPPDDCGGIFGYYHNLEIIKDSTHEEYDDIVEWLGEDFDPNTFNLDDINRALLQFRRQLR